MPRILVVGSSCAGKTTFAQALAQRLDVPHVQLDALHHLPGWQPRPPEELRALVAEAIAVPDWIVDGNYWRLRELIWPRATHLIWLNYSFPRVMARAFKRTISRVVTQEELYNGNRETFRRAFMSRDSMLLWVPQAFPRRRREYRRIFDHDAMWSMQKLEFTHPRDAERYLASVS